MTRPGELRVNGPQRPAWVRDDEDMNSKALAVALVGVVAGTASAAPPGLTPPATLAAEAEPEPEGPPPLSGGRVLGEFLLGGVTGAVGVVGGAYIGYGLETSGGCGGEWCGIGGMIVGGFVGYTLAAPIGVYAVGSSGDQTGSFGWTYGGSLIGGGVGILLAASGSEGGAVLGLASPLIGAMIGFNATRRYKERPARPRNPRVWTPTASVSSNVSTFGIAGNF